MGCHKRGPCALLAIDHCDETLVGTRRAPPKTLGLERFQIESIQERQESVRRSAGARAVTPGSVTTHERSTALVALGYQATGISVSITYTPIVENLGSLVVAGQVV